MQIPPQAEESPIGNMPLVSIIRKDFLEGVFNCLAALRGQLERRKQERVPDENLMGSPVGIP